MILDACTWDNPGADRYTGTSRAAIAAMVSIPAPVRAVLIERAERRIPDYDDVIYIDREAIRGTHHAYAPTLRFMAFGGAGRVCQTVTRTGWDDRRIESAMVFCEGDYCIARPSICNNWSIVTRLSPAAGLEPAAVADEPIADPQAPEAVTLGSSDHTAETPDGPASFHGSTGGPYTPSFGGGGYHHSPGVVPAVPEPKTAALLLAGLAAVGVVARRKTK